MSHDHGRRAACSITLLGLWFHFRILSEARGVTAMAVGSGALLGLLPRIGWHASSVYFPFLYSGGKMETIGPTYAVSS
jgi:hypothetical protein